VTQGVVVGEPSIYAYTDVVQVAVTCVHDWVCCVLAGNARWAPAVSEYRQADLKYPLQHAAECMLTTAPPAEAGDLLEATAQLTTMGRCAEGALLRKLGAASGSKQHTQL
jgi:hypothetical protein